MSDDRIRLMEVCGTHTMAIARAGIKQLLPDSVALLSGPGCPVCVTSARDIDRALALGRQKDVTFATFGDMMRVPGSRGSLQDLKREGHDVRVVYSCLDALEVARRHPGRQVVFMGVGFETTSPTVAATVLKARRAGIRNFSVFSCFKLIFPALETLLRAGDVRVDGFLCPGHVSVITGSRPYERIARRFGKPCVITGFEPSDIIGGISTLIRLIRHRRPRVVIEYKRAVRPAGNRKAAALLATVFEPVTAAWRGLGTIPDSGLAFRRAFRDFDAARRWPVRAAAVREPAGCLCGAVLRGSKAPGDCRLFGKKCVPERPVGPCMVSSEGACAAFYRYEGNAKGALPLMAQMKTG
ncbi:MAG: hydrogenase formation protein HypD [Deltaproteobacteria bacterium]